MADDVLRKEIEAYIEAKWKAIWELVVEYLDEDEVKEIEEKYCIKDLIKEAITYRIIENEFEDIYEDSSIVRFTIKNNRLVVLDESDKELDLDSTFATTVFHYIRFNL